MFFLIENKINLLSNVISQRVLNYCDIKEKIIIIWGLTSWAKLCVHELKKNNIVVHAIIDKDTHLVNSRDFYLDIPIYDLDFGLKEIEGKEKDLVLVIASSHYQEMKEYIMKLNHSIDESLIISLYPNNEEKVLNAGESNGECLTLKECHIKLVETLKDFLSVLDKYQIRYYLAYGSLLGCVREATIIPWDDDIDIEIPWGDYLRLCRLRDMEVIGLDNFQSPLSVATWKNTITTLGKVYTLTTSDYVNFPLCSNQGLAIDIWPLINFPNSYHEQIEYGKRLTEAGDMWKENVVMRMESDNYDEDIHRKSINKLTTLLSEYSIGKYDYCGVGYCGQLDIPDMNRAFSKDMYKPVYKEFEGMYCCVPCGYDLILQRNYGDYMKPPDQDFVMRFENVHSI